MASLQDVINIIIQADDQASRALGAVGDAVSALDGKVQGVAKPFADLANGVLLAETALAAMAVTIGTLAVKETIKFQDSLYNVQKQLGDSGVSIEQARQDIETLALQYGLNANEVAASMANFLAAGNDYANSADLVKVSTQLMIAGQLDAKFATDAITKSLAGFRVPAGEVAEGAQKVGDVLNKIGDISSGSFEEIVGGFSRIAPTAKDAGLSMEEAAASVAVLVDIFGSGEVAATSLKSGLLALLTPSKEAADTMQSLGVSSTASNGELRSAKDIMSDLAGKMAGLTDSQRLQTAAVIFGKEQAGAMNALLGDWGKQQNYVAQMMDATTGATGSMAREVEGKLKLISTATGIANESWRQFLENLGARITDGGDLKGLIDSVGKLGLAFKEVVNAGGLDPVIENLQGKFADVQALIETVAKNLPAAFDGVDWSGLTDSIDDLADMAADLFSDFFGDIDLTTVEGLQSAIQTTVDTIESLTLVTTGIIAEFRPFAQAIGEAAREFNGLDTASKIDFGSTLGIMKALVDTGTGLGLTLIAIGRAGVDVGEVVDRAFGVVGVAINGLQVGFDGMMLALSEINIAVVESLIKWETLKGKFDFSDESKAKRAASIEALKGDLAEWETFSDAIAENLKRNAGEFSDAWTKASGDAGDGSNKLRASLDAAEWSLLSSREASRGAAQAMSDLGNAAAAPAEQITLMTAAQIKGASALDAFAAGFGGLKTGMDSTGIAAGMLAIRTDEAGNSLTQMKAATGGFVDVIRDGEGKITGYRQAIGSAGVAMSETAKKTQEATEKSDEFQIKMEEIASNERIKTIEAVVSLNVARLETDAERVKATFASIDNTISSTGDLLGSLFGSLNDASAFDKLGIQDQIDKENRLRQESFEMQKRLAEAEIARVEAQTQALARGDALIQIDGSGLAPQLESFMWEILKAIRVRANAEFQDYLLGMGTA